MSAEPTVDARAAQIGLAIFDIDGVMTDGSLILGPDAQEFKTFNVRDGHGLVMLRDNGVMIAVITGRRSRVVEERMQQLGIHYVFQGQSNKLEAFERLLADTGMQPERVSYMGDDLPDIPVMRQCGLPVAVADAHPRVIANARYVTSVGGGRGAVRELSEMILSAQGKLENEYAKYDGDTRLSN